MNILNEFVRITEHNKICVDSGNMKAMDFVVFEKKISRLNK